MPDLMAIFEKQALKYDMLVTREDYNDNLLPALQGIVPFHGKKVIEFGAGTGRITRLLAPLVLSIAAFDSSAPMIVEAEKRLQDTGRLKCKFRVADHRSVPAPDGGADIAIAGWSICCLAVFTGQHWQQEVDAGLAEMRRVVHSGGKVIIIETLGTGFFFPTAPEVLRPYYDRLSQEGFQSTWIRTDYLFKDMEEALDLTVFFFGNDPVPSLMKTPDGVVLPECTGIWWKTIYVGPD